VKNEKKGKSRGKKNSQSGRTRTVGIILVQGWKRKGAKRGRENLIPGATAGRNKTAEGEGNTKKHETSKQSKNFEKQTQKENW